VIEPYRVSTEAIRESVASLPDAGRRDLAAALQALSQVAAVQNALGEQFDEHTVEVFGLGEVLLYTASRSSSGPFRSSSCSGLGDLKRHRCARAWWAGGQLGSGRSGGVENLDHQLRF
jgi:hypothetical protein